MIDQPTITLINGPWNGKTIEDLGTVIMLMAIYDPSATPGARCGVSIYEPTADRSKAFWSHNEWQGTVEAIIHDDDDYDDGIPF